MTGYCVLPVPCVLSGGELETLAVPDYGFTLCFGNDLPMNVELPVPALATDARMNQPVEITWTNEADAKDAAQIQYFLFENGASYKTPDVQTATGDFDSDGADERVIFVSPQRDENGYQIISAENRMLFTFALWRDNDESYRTIFSRFKGYTDKVTQHEFLSPVGVYDLNADGKYEVCATLNQWEGGRTYVFADTDYGFVPVLRSNWGS